MSRIDDMLDKTFAYGVDWTEYKDKSEYDHDTSMFAAKIKAQHKQALKSELLQAVLEVIGEDEEYEANDPDPVSIFPLVRTSLRKEQRKRAKELFGEEE